MGISSDKSEKKKTISIDSNIKLSTDDMNSKEEKIKIENEDILSNNADNLKVIEYQKEFNICMIIEEDKEIGTGFLSLIPFPDKLYQILVLITCNNFINGNKKEVN